MLKGADISVYNGNCNLAVAKASGLDFVIIKAGSRMTPKDGKFERNYAQAKGCGLPVGAYWYCYARSVSQAVDEANMFLAAIRGKTFEYPLWLDLEDRTQGGLSNRVRTDIAVAFMDVLEKRGYYTGIYSMKYWFETKFDMVRLRRYDVWIAHWYVSRTNYKGAYGMWQYTNKGRVPGINNTGEGGIDLNYSYKDYENIIKANGLNGFKKTPKVASKNIDIAIVYDNEADYCAAYRLKEVIDQQSSGITEVVKGRFTGIANRIIQVGGVDIPGSDEKIIGKNRRETYKLCDNFIVRK